MNCPKRSLTNTQQAPSRVQSARRSPTQSASMNAHSISGGTTSQIRYSPSRVSSACQPLANRLARTQPTGPTLRAGAGRSGLKTCFSMALALHQRDALVVQVHQQGNAQADGQVHAHGDGHGLDGLAGLVEHGPGEQTGQAI